MTKKENCEAQREKHQTEETQIVRKKGYPGEREIQRNKKERKILAWEKGQIGSFGLYHTLLSI